MPGRKILYVALGLSLLANLAFVIRHVQTPRPISANIVFAGDSLTDFGDWSELPGAINLGIRGSTTAAILARIDSITARRPKAVFLMAGVNDALEHRAVDSAASNYAEIVQRLSPQAVVYMESVLPVTDRVWLAHPLVKDHAPALNAWIDDFNKRIATLADNRTVFYVPLHDDFLKDGQMDPNYTVDGVHLTQRGYKVWQSDILPLVLR